MTIINLRLGKFLKGLKKEYRYTFVEDHHIHLVPFHSTLPCFPPDLYDKFLVTALFSVSFQQQSKPSYAILCNSAKIDQGYNSYIYIYIIMLTNWYRWRRQKLSQDLDVTQICKGFFFAFKLTAHFAFFFVFCPTENCS